MYNEALSKLRQFFRSHKRLPSYQEMCDVFGFASKKASFSLAKKLIAEGILEKGEGGKLVPGKMFSPLPLLGVVRAGMPIPQEEQVLDVLSFDTYLVDQPETSYMLRVSGDSMIDAGIHGGDIVIVDKAKRPHNGNIVVAAIDNEVTLKYFEKKQGAISLIPANPLYPVIHPTGEVRIEGVVVSVMRKY